MPEIILKVPEGTHCNDEDRCMFLDTGYDGRHVFCRLFGTPLRHENDFGVPKMDSIEKTERCPVLE